MQCSEYYPVYYFTNDSVFTFLSSSFYDHTLVAIQNVLDAMEKSERFISREQNESNFLRAIPSEDLGVGGKIML
jgi:hypothetical protein